MQVSRQTLVWCMKKYVVLNMYFLVFNCFKPYWIEKSKTMRQKFIINLLLLVIHRRSCTLTGYHHLRAAQAFKTFKPPALRVSNWGYVCCRHRSGRRRPEHLVFADEGPVELVVHREHPENHQTPLWHVHWEVAVELSPCRLSVGKEIVTNPWLEYFSLRWLEVGVGHLTSAPCWVIYLQVLQEAVWPGGTLPAQPRAERSAAEREETKRHCLNCLMKLMPGGWNQQNLKTELGKKNWINMKMHTCICLRRAHHWPVGKREVQTQLGDDAGVVAGPADKQVSRDQIQKQEMFSFVAQRDKFILLTLSVESTTRTDCNIQHSHSVHSPSTCTCVLV